MGLIWLAYCSLWEDMPLQQNHPVALEYLEDIKCLHLYGSNHLDHVAGILGSRVVLHQRRPVAPQYLTIHGYGWCILYVVYHMCYGWLICCMLSACKVLKHGG